MIQRGKKSASAGAVVIEGGFSIRPDPPADLTERQAEIWRIVVASENPDFFATAVLRGLLADYCRRREAAESLSETINAVEPEEYLQSRDGIKVYAQLLRLRDMEVKGAISLATKLRLTNQSRYEKKGATTAARNERAKVVGKPWQM